MFEGKDEIRVAVVAGGSVQPCTLAGSDAWRVVVGEGGGLAHSLGWFRSPPQQEPSAVRRADF